MVKNSYIDKIINGDNSKNYQAVIDKIKKDKIIKKIPIKRNWVEITAITQPEQERRMMIITKG
jgi:hypothetical protein